MNNPQEAGEYDVFTYDSVTDLETTIDDVLDDCERFMQLSDTLLEQVGAFLNYQHDPATYKETAKDVSSSYVDPVPGIVIEYAEKQLEDPDDAKNWEELRQAYDDIEVRREQLRTAHENVWHRLGYSEQEYIEEVTDMVPFSHLMRQWEQRPHALLANEEGYRSYRREDGPTPLARHQNETVTRKQARDRRRGRRLEQITDEQTDLEPGHPALTVEIPGSDKWAGSAD
ncbi:MAG: hypothetical protein MUP66_01955 [Candidatus Nanohaloarchaeota archaeon QJJ-5]|nr:hypothetical protein [Candidatus Nanohaloarchaeota archaeon QJJ-5]